VLHSEEIRIEVARRHVAMGESLVRRQKAIIERLSARGYPAAYAQTLLALLERTLQLMYAHLAHEHLAAQRQLTDVGASSPARSSRFT
jgi:enoyl-CoA hydratase/carnithine racemase